MSSHKRISFDESEYYSHFSAKFVDTAIQKRFKGYHKVLEYFIVTTEDGRKMPVFTNLTPEEKETFEGWASISCITL